MKHVLVVLAVFASMFMAITIVWADDGEAGGAGVSGERVDTVLAGLLADGTYSYDEASLDDPAWLMALREWFRQLRQRWGQSPVAQTTGGGFALIGLIMAVLLVLGILGLILPRFMSRRARFGAEGPGGEAEDGREGSWGEAGARRAMELAGAGMLREAVSLLFGSTLRGLDNMGWIHYRKSHASRGYLRQLRRSAELYPLFRDFLGRFEVAYYRKARPDEDDWTFMYDGYQSLARAASTIRPPVFARRR